MEETFGIDRLLTEISHIVYCWRWKEKSGNINPQWTFIHPHLLTINHPITVHSHSQSPRCHPFQPIKIQNPPFQISIPLNQNPQNPHHHSSIQKKKKKKQKKQNPILHTSSKLLLPRWEKEKIETNTEKERKTQKLFLHWIEEKVSRIFSLSLWNSVEKKSSFQFDLKIRRPCWLFHKKKKKKKKMKRVFGVKKDKEPPPSINDASDRVSHFPLLSFPFSHCFYLFIFYNLFNYCCVWFWRK